MGDVSVTIGEGPESDDADRIARRLITAIDGDCDLRRIALGEVMTDAVEGLTDQEAINLLASAAAAAAAYVRFAAAALAAHTLQTTDVETLARELPAATRFEVDLLFRAVDNDPPDWARVEGDAG